jgi:hypothetical protein
MYAQSIKVWGNPLANDATRRQAVLVVDDDRLVWETGFGRFDSSLVRQTEA